MLSNNLLSIDLAKSSFHIHLVTAEGRKLLSQKVSRSQLAAKVASLDASVVVMEACSSANYWARKFQKMNLTVKLIAPQFVKPFVKSQKNDRNDAEAIAEAAQRPSMRFVPVKSVEQQTISTYHRLRERLIVSKTMLTNQMRGILGEFGISIAQGDASLVKFLTEFKIPEDSDFPPVLAEDFAELHRQYRYLVSEIAKYDAKLEKICRENERCKEVLKISGVGPVTASAVFAAVGNGTQFKNGRQFSAFLGLVPRQNSTGGKTRLQGISKHGDTYLRTLLVHGARASLISAHKRNDYRSRWACSLKEKKGYNRAAVALANRNARTIFKLLTTSASFDSTLAEKQSTKGRTKAA